MELITRYTTPTRYDTAPYGSVTKVIHDENNTSLWIQTNDDPDKPNWKPISDFLEEIFIEHLENPSFIKLLLDIHKKKIAINSILNE